MNQSMILQSIDLLMILDDQKRKIIYNVEIQYIFSKPKLALIIFIQRQTHIFSYQVVVKDKDSH